MEVVVQIIGLLTALVGLITTWLQFRRERQNGSRRNDQPHPRYEPSPVRSREPRRGCGCRQVILTIVGILITLMGLGFFASVTFQPTVPVGGSFCCAQFGRCPLPFPGVPGTPCFCSDGFSTHPGYTCY